MDMQNGWSPIVGFPVDGIPDPLMLSLLLCLCNGTCRTSINQRQCVCPFTAKGLTEVNYDPICR